MNETSQRHAIKRCRNRLVERGMARFEVLGRIGDRTLIRLFAKRLAEDSPDSARLRAAVIEGIAGAPRRTGGILAALRRSPLVGACAIPARRFERGRKVDL